MTKQTVAIKVIKNKQAYFNQSMVEVTILQLLNSWYDATSCKTIVRMLDTFMFRKHLCIVFEPLSINLYELIKQNNYKGLSLSLVRTFSLQLLDALALLAEAKIIHCDLKLENVLLQNLESPQIKVIDFGSACHDQQTVYSYIQSRFYRSPEVLLGLSYSTSIDIWSMGCISGELFLGLPLFPGHSEYDQVSRITQLVQLPPAYMLEFGKNSSLYFQKLNSVWQLKPLLQYNQERQLDEKPGKKYFAATKLSQLVMDYPLPKRIANNPADQENEMNMRRCFLDFLRGLLTLNPLERWSATQARQHPFITQKPWTGPYVPEMIPRKVVDTLDDDSPPVRRTRASTLTSAKLAIPAQLQELAISKGSELPKQPATATAGGGMRKYTQQRDTPRLSLASSSAEPLNEIRGFAPLAKNTAVLSRSRGNLSSSRLSSQNSLSHSATLHEDPQELAQSPAYAYKKKSRSQSVSQAGNQGLWLKMLGTTAMVSAPVTASSTTPQDTKPMMRSSSSSSSSQQSITTMPRHGSMSSMRNLASTNSLTLINEDAPLQNFSSPSQQQSQDQLGSVTRSLTSQLPLSSQSRSRNSMARSRRYSQSSTSRDLTSGGDELPASAQTPPQQQFRRAPSLTFSSPRSSSNLTTTTAAYGTSPASHYPQSPLSKSVQYFPDTQSPPPATPHTADNAQDGGDRTKKQAAKKSSDTPG